MADDSRLEVIIGAQTAELKAGMAQAQAAVKASVNEIKSSFSDLTSMLATVGKVAMGVGAILAGGALFKGVIEKYVEMNSEARKLSTIMGMNMSDAQALLESFKRVGVEGDTVTSALAIMTRQLKANEEGFNANKIVTRDASGNLLSMNEIMFNVIDRLKEMKEGTERNMLATTVFGRSVGNLPGFLKMTEEAVAAMKKRLDDLGITLDDVSAAKARAYKEGMRDVGLVSDALKYKIGEQLIPVLIQLGHLFAEIGPPAIKALGSILAAGQDLLMRLTVIATQIRDSFLAAWDLIKIGAQTASNVAAAAIRGNFTEAAAAVAAGYAAMKQSSEDWREQATRDANDVKFAIMNAMQVTGKPGQFVLTPMGPKTIPEAPEEKPKGGAAYVGKDEGKGAAGKGAGGKGPFQEWQKEWEEIRVAESKFLESSLKQERDFWQAKLEGCREGTEEYSAVRHKLLTIEKQIAKEEYDSRLADLKLKQEIDKQDRAQRLTAEDDKLKMAAAAYGQDSKQYKDALREKQRLLNQFHKEENGAQTETIKHKEKLALMDLEMEESNIKHLQKMGKLSRAQELADLNKLEVDKYKIKLKALMDEAKLDKLTETEKRKLLQKEEILAKEHQGNLQKLDRDYAATVSGTWGEMFSSIKSAFTSLVSGLFQGTADFASVMLGLVSSLVGSLANMLIDLVVQFVESLIIGEAASKAQAALLIKDHAAVAYAAAFAATCAIPIIGPELAPAVATAAWAAAFAGGIGHLATAAQGWDVPADTLAYVHKKEMILPPDLAENVRRGFAAPPAGAGTLMRDVTISPTIIITEPLTRQSARRLVRRDLMPAIQEEMGRYLKG